MFIYNFFLIIIFIVIYFFQKIYIYFIFFIVFFLCSLLFIYLGAVLLSLKKKNKKINIYSIYILIKKLSRIILTLILLLNSNSNADLITLYSNYIIENGLNDDPTIQEVVDELEVTPNQQYYLKIGGIAAAVSIVIVIMYVLNNWFRPEGPSESYSGTLTRSSSSSSLSSVSSSEPTYFDVIDVQKGINVSDVILPIAITGSAIEFTLNILEVPVPVKEDIVNNINLEVPVPVKEDIVNNINLEVPVSVKEKESSFFISLENNIDSSDIDIESISISSDDNNTLDLPSQGVSNVIEKGDTINDDNDYLNLLIEEADAEYEDIIYASKMGFDLMEIERVTLLSEIESLIQNLKRYELLNPEISLKLEMAVDSEGIPIFKVLKEQYSNYYSYIDSGGELNTPKYDIVWNDLINIWMKVPESYKKLFI